MASDVQKAVDIALKLTGIDAKQITPLVTAFQNLEKNVKSTQTSINNLQKSLNALKTPAAITSLSKSFSDLSKVKLKDLGPLTANLTKLSKISSFPNIGTFVNNIQKLSTVSFAGLQGVTKQFQSLVGLNIGSIVSKIRGLNTALVALNKQGMLSTFANFATNIKNMTTALTAAQGPIKQMSNSLQNLGNTAQSGGAKLRTFGDKIKTVFDFRLISEGFMLLREGISSGVTAIIDYDQALKDLQAITGATNTEVAQMGEKILEVATNTKFSASEVAEGMRTLGQAGFSASESIQTIQAVSDLATGTLSDMAQTVDLITTAMRVFQIDASESSKVADVFANAVNRSKLTIEKLRTSMNYVGPVAHNVGISFQEVSAAMMTLANSGLRASTIGTSLRQVLAQLAAPSKKFRQAAHEAGIAMQDLDPTTNSLSTVLANLRLVITDTGVAFDVFGKRGASAAIALTSQNSQYDKLLEVVTKTGTAAEMAAKQMEGLGVSFKNFRDKLGNLAIALGKGGISTVMKGIVDIARGLIDVLIAVANTAFGGLIIKTGVLITTIGVLVGTFVALKTALAGSAIATFAGTIASITKATWAAVFATQAWNAALKANPIIFLITSLVTLAAAIYAVTNGFGLFNNTTSETSQEATKLADEFGVLTKKVNDYLVNTVGMKEGSNELKHATIGLRDELVKIANEMGPLSNEARKAADSIDPLEGSFINGKDALLEFQKAADNLQTKKLQEALSASTTALKNQMDFMPRWVARMQDAFGVVWDYLGMTGDAILATLNLKFNEIPKIFGNAIAKLTGRGQEIDAAFDLSKRINKDIASLAEIEKAIASYGTKMTALQKNIKTGYDEVMEKASNFVDKLRETGQINLDSTVEDVKRIGKSANMSKLDLEAISKIFTEIQKNSQSARNVLEKWSKDPGALKLSQDVKVLDDMYDALGRTIYLQQRKEAEGIEKIRGERLKEYQDLQKLKPALDASLNEWKNYYQAEQNILNKIREDRKAASTNIFANLESELAQAHAAHAAQLERINEEYKNKNQERARQTVQADQILANERAKIFKNFVDTVVEQSEEISEGFESEVDEMSGEFTKLEKESQKAWKNIGSHSDSTLKEQVQAINNWAGIVQEKMYKFSEVTKETLSKLGDNLALALQKGDLEQIKAIEEAIKEVTDKGSEYYEQMGDSIAEVLDHIASKESELLDNIETYAQKVLEIQKEVEGALFDLTQKRMTASEKYESNRLKAEEKFRQAALASAEASRLSGEEAIKAQEKASALAEEGYQLTLKLQSAIKVTKELEEDIAKSKEKEKQLRQELQTLTASDEQDAKQIKKVQEDIAKEVAKQKGLQQELTTSAQAYETVQSNILEYQQLMETAEEGKVKASKDALAVLGQQKTELESLKTTIDEMQTSLENFELDLNLEAAKAELLDFATEVDTLATEPKELKFAVDPEGSAKEEIVKIGDTWTNVWTDAVGESTNQIKSFETALGNLKGKAPDVGVVQMGGSTTKPITEKIAEIKSKWEDLAKSLSKKIEIEILLKGIEKAINQTKDLIKKLKELKDKTITITTRYKTEGTPPSKRRWGGRLPGYGGGDKQPVLAESGEWFIRKEAVKKYGDSLFSALNSMSLPKFQDGGKVGTSLLSSKQTTSSSIMDSLLNFGTVNLVTEGMSVPAIVHSDVIQELSTHLNKMRRFGT